MSEDIPSGRAHWQALRADFSEDHRATLSGWLDGTSRSWHLEAVQQLATWAPPQRAVAAVLLYLDFKENSRQSSRIAAENAIDRAPIPSELLPALPWGFFERWDILEYDWQLRDVLRVLESWSVDVTDAVLAVLPEQPAPRNALYIWLGKQPPHAHILTALARGLADKSAPIVTRCADALAAHGEPAVPAVTEALSAPATKTRRAAAQTLERIASPRAEAALRAALQEERSAKTRDAMQRALEQSASRRSPTGE